MPKNIAEVGDTGKYTTMKLDGLNNPHISYYDADNGDLMYTKYDGWNWNTTTVDSTGDVGEYASLVLDRFDNPHIAYYDATNQDLKYAHYDGSNWTNITVDSEGDVGKFAWIDVSTNVNPHIAYRDETNTNLKYAYYNGSSWINMTLDGNWGGFDNVGEYASLQLDSANWPHIAYYNATAGDLMYMYNDGSTWYKLAAYSTNNVGVHASLALDSNDHPHIAHYNMQFQNLMYTNFDGGNWTTEAVDSPGRVGEYCAIAVDSNDLPHIAYVDRDNGGVIKYAHKNQSWDLSEIDEEGEYISIDIDTQNRAHFSYYDLSDQDLRYLSHSGANVDQITQSITFNQNWGGIGLAIDSQDVPHVAYQNLTGGVKTISYATLNVSATQITGYNVWIIETVDTNLGDTAGSWLSIDLDSQDRPHISYYSGDGVNSIKYAFKNSTGWHNHTVDSGLNKLGWFSAIKIDSTDNPQIAYSRIEGNTLKYAIYDGSSWHTENVGAQVGGDKKGLQLALSAADVPHLCYFDQNLLQLGYATYSGSSWVKETNVISDDLDMDLSLARGRYCDIEVDQYGDPHITFDYNVLTEIGYLKKNGTSWDGRNLSLSHGSSVIGYTQLELDSSENPCFSYADNHRIETNKRDVYFGCIDTDSGEIVLRESGLLHTDHYFSHSDWGRYLSMKLDSNDSAHLAFFNKQYSNVGNVMYYTDNFYPTFDSDGDGIPDYEDSFPSNPSETTDYDGDGSGDNADNDDDDDGVIDLLDNCQFGIIGPGADFDGDGCKDSEDDDDDNDGFADEVDDCPQGMTGIGYDLDADGCQDAEDSDIDGDGIPNDEDDFDLDPSEDTDSDGDGVGDNTDEFPDDGNETIDSDGDGTGDNADQFPDDANETVDSDGDGVGDNADAFDDDANETVDSDADGVGDNSDAFPNDANESSDFDGDGIGDNADSDYDGDNVSDDIDAFPLDPNEWNDTDEDGVGDNTDAFPNDVNESVDSDGDGFGDNADAFPYDANESSDFDSDGVGDNADAFPEDSNETTDTDSDGVGDNADICPGGDDLIDVDNDGLPDYCDILVDSDGDGYDDAIDAFPNDITEWIDSDGDGVGNNADAYPADPNRSQGDENQNNAGNTKPVSGDSEQTEESASWVELLESGGLSQEMFLSIVGVVVLLLFMKIGLSSRKIKNLKQELQELSESKAVWERLDLDEDGELSDLELEAYKLIRDKGKQPDTAVEAMESTELRDDGYAPHQTNEFVDDATNDWLRDETLM
ncbi:MAG: thrombospondin type 3 repeat-containing protein [Candidatus Thermoplasmatota archaeon]|nr:thrombospondin type 3 repeat-containing protein [Candidatus Thermoplasmatota archaeon]